MPTPTRTPPASGAQSPDAPDGRASPATPAPAPDAADAQALPRSEGTPPSLSRATSAGYRNEPEVELAEFEVRMRGYVLELVRPTILKVRMLEHALTDIRGELAQNAQALAGMSQVAARVEQQVIAVEGFRVELSTWDTDRRQFQAETATSLAQSRQDLLSLRAQVEQQEVAIHAAQRSTERMLSELGKVREDTEDLRQHVEVRFGQQSKLLHTKATDLEVKLANLEDRHTALNDDLFGEGSGLAKLAHDLVLTNDQLSSVSGDVANLQQDKASVAQFEAVHAELVTARSEARANAEQLTQTLETSTAEVKAHFLSANNAISAHTAAMVHEVRASYRGELSEAARLRADLVEVMDEARQNMARMQDTVSTSQGQTEEMLRKLSQELQEADRLRRRDRGLAEAEARAVQERLGEAQSCSGEVSRCLAHLSSVMWMLLQSERAASALDLQDDTDRAKVALMGYRDARCGSAGLAGPAAPPTPAWPGGPGSRRSTPSPAHGRPRSRAAGAATPTPRGAAEPAAAGAVLSLDERCLSCSGQAQAVLSGFKMACLQYTPGPVAFAKKSYGRTELLELRDTLLNQANEALQSGPGSSAYRDSLLQKDLPLLSSFQDATMLGETSKTDDLEGCGSRSSLSSNPSPAPNLPPLTSRTPTGAVAAAAAAVPRTGCGPRFGTLHICPARCVPRRQMLVLHRRLAPVSRRGMATQRRLPYNRGRG